MSQIPDFEALFRVSPYPYLLMDRRLIIVGAYSAYLKSTGRVEADLLGRYVSMPSPKIRTIRRRLGAALNGGRTVRSSPQ